MHRLQDRILRDYADDFGKHTNADTANKVRLIWNAIPSQIARDNNKFIFSHVKQGARAKDLEDALEWLVSAGIAYKLNMVPIYTIFRLKEYVAHEMGGIKHLPIVCSALRQIVLILQCGCYIIFMFVFRLHLQRNDFINKSI